MNTKHNPSAVSSTPGPWAVREEHDEEATLLDIWAGSLRVCRIGYACPPAVADARLIAAAPELLEALQDAIEALVDKYGPDAACVRDARAAIAKAEGT